MKILKRKIEQFKTILKDFNQISDIGYEEGEFIVYLNHFDVFNFIANQREPIKIRVRQNCVKDEELENYYLA